MPVLSPVVNPVKYLCVLWERPGIHLNLPKHKEMPTITVHFQKKPIRVYGLPDNPTFDCDDIRSILSISEEKAVKILVPELEVRNESNLTLAGVYKLIFNHQQDEVSLKLQQFFCIEIEPALRKYGFPSQTVPVGVSNN